MKIGPYETGRVYVGNSLELLRAIPDGSVPMIWTDPPYGHANQDGDLAAARVGVKGARQADAAPIVNDRPEDYEPLIRGFLAESARIMRPDSCCCCCCGGGGPSPTFARLSLWMDEALSFFHAVVWDKSGAGNGLGWRYRRNYEFVMVAHRKGGKLAWNDARGAMPNIARDTPPRNRTHPNQKPLDLMRWFIENHTQPGDLVLDPFAGSGSTGVAAIQAGREFLGFELDQQWADVANARLEAARPTGQVSMFSAEAK